MFIINESMSNCPVISLGASEFDELGTGTINMSGWAVSGSHRSTAHINGTRWGLKNMMEWAKFVAYEQNVVMYNFLKNFVMSFDSGAEHQASNAIASKQLQCQKNLHNYILFICYKLCLLHQILKFLTWSQHD